MCEMMETRRSHMGIGDPDLTVERKHEHIMNGVWGLVGIDVRCVYFLFVVLLIGRYSDISRSFALELIPIHSKRTGNSLVISSARCTYHEQPGYVGIVFS